MLFGSVLPAMETGQNVNVNKAVAINACFKSLFIPSIPFQNSSL